MDDKIVEQDKIEHRTSSASWFSTLNFLLIVGVIGFSYYQYTEHNALHVKFLESNTDNKNQSMSLTDKIKNYDVDIADIDAQLVELNDKINNNHLVDKISFLDRQIKDINVVIANELGKEKDSLNVAISYIGDATRYARKMATWGFAIEALQLAKYNLLHYPEYLDRLASIQEELESYSLAPWFEIQKIINDVESIGANTKSDEHNQISTEEKVKGIKAIWHKVKGSIKIRQVSDKEHSILVREGFYLLKNRINLSLETAAYALLTDKREIYEQSIDKATLLLGTQNSDNKFNDVIEKLAALKEYSSPVQKLINDLDKIKLNLLSQQHGSSDV